MKWPFVSRKRYDAVTERMAEAIARLEDEVNKLRYQENTELRALREALFHRGRAEALEKTILDRVAVTPPQTVFMPAQNFAHNAQETRTPREPVVNDGDSATDIDTE